MASAMQQPHEVTLSREQGEALIARVYASDLPHTDCTVVAQIIRLHFWLRLAMQEAKLSLKRLRQMLFGEPAPGRSESALAPLAEAEPHDHCDASPAFDTSRAERTPRDRGGHRPGQGRLGVDAYGGEGVEMRLDGHALLSACGTSWKNFAARRAERCLPPNCPRVSAQTSIVPGLGRRWHLGGMCWGCRFIVSSRIKPWWAYRYPMQHSEIRLKRLPTVSTRSMSPWWRWRHRVK